MLSGAQNVDPRRMRGLQEQQASLENGIKDINSEINKLSAQSSGLDRNQELQLSELKNQHADLSRQHTQMSEQLRIQGEELASQSRQLDSQGSEIEAGKVQAGYEEARQGEREGAAERQRSYAEVMQRILERDCRKFCDLTKRDALERQGERDEWLLLFSSYIRQLAAKALLGSMSSSQPRMPSTRQVRPLAGDVPSELAATAAAKQAGDAEAAAREGRIGLNSRYDQTRTQEEKLAAARNQLVDKGSQVDSNAALSRQKIDAAESKLAEQRGVLSNRYDTNKGAIDGNIDRLNDRTGEIQRRIDDVVGRMRDSGAAV